MSIIKRKRDLFNRLLERDGRNHGEESQPESACNATYISSQITNPVSQHRMLQGDHLISPPDIWPPSMDLRSRLAFQNYVHSPLDQNRKQFRLFRLQHIATYHSGSQETVEVCGELATFEFDHTSTPEYVALSYTWGSPNRTYQILINEKHRTVRDNLFNFLCAYRKDSHIPSFGSTRLASIS
ncbi:hypothetical protein T440DRAFT_517125 [Plenodomus tracheiphilus IPT5]|uniref:Uncharacterized protein n=1 Tax=Plenodomus tracheiphilus IPT5 TaxID=1408161 RepID=A0A6A7B8R5_9PLEO|nr:hypothetical protein T440DRAFT_517125 [Plenodomus tracheiphilus IPT5]